MLMNLTPPRWLLVGNTTKSPVSEKVVSSVQISTTLCKYLFCANTSADIHALDLRRESLIQDQFSLYITSQGSGWNRRVELSFDSRDVLIKSEQHSMLHKHRFFKFLLRLLQYSAEYMITWKSSSRFPRLL